jgi:hypothetical protein
MQIIKYIYTKLKGVQFQVCVHVRRYQEFKVSYICVMFMLSATGVSKRCPPWRRTYYHVDCNTRLEGYLDLQSADRPEQLSQKLRSEVWWRTTTPKNIDSSSCNLKIILDAWNYIVKSLLFIHGNYFCARTS